MRRLKKHTAAALLAVLGLMTAWPAQAHRSSAGGATDGLPIANLAHGEMAVIARYRDEILDLATTLRQSDEPFRRLVNFGNIQYSYCLWGIVPGSVGDEASPFNECAHAYLAATKAVLLDLQTRPQVAGAAAHLASRIDAELVQIGGSLVLCQYSDAGFNTADVMRPHWNDIPAHLPSLASFAGAGLLVLLAGAALFGAPFKGRRRT